MENADLLKRIPYPVLVLTTYSYGRFYGQAVVWSTQVSYEPVRFQVALGFTRHTSKQLSIGAPVALQWVSDIGVARFFGRLSGRDVNKFTLPECPVFEEVRSGGVPFPVLRDTALVVLGEVSHKRAVGSHSVFLVDVQQILKRGMQFVNYDYGSI